jgi:polyhydroxybutyrate depolymerase
LAIAAGCTPRTAPGATNEAAVRPGATSSEAVEPASVSIAADGAPVLPSAATAPPAAPDGARPAVGDGGLAPRGSAGCDAATAPSAPERLIVAGAERAFLARVPAGPAEAPRDLVIAFHGRTNDALQVRRYFRLDAALPEAIVVYPRALPAAPGTFAWASPGDATDGLRDFALVEALIDAFAASHCIDLDRIFVVGHSLGAYFANDVACRLGDRLRAVASVAGGLQGGSCTGGVAALLMHHPDDPLVPVGAGEHARDAFRSANGVAAAAPTPAAHPALAALRCVWYGDEDAPDPVAWCAHDDATGPGGRRYAHTWPDAAPAAIAAFFGALH